MLAEKNQKHKPVANLSTYDESDADTKKQVKLHPFVHHFKQKVDTDSPKYKVDDSIIWNSVTYYFCDCPTHKNKLEWDTNIVETCRT